VLFPGKLLLAPGSAFRRRLAIFFLIFAWINDGFAGMFPVQKATQAGYLNHP
jgi:hypothetical protein